MGYPDSWFGAVWLPNMAEEITDQGAIWVDQRNDVLDK